MKITPTGVGLWIWRIKACSNGDWATIIGKCKQYGVQWLAVKIGESARDNSQWSRAAAQSAIKKCHDNGIKIYGWNYSRPNSIVAEVNLIEDCMKDGLDGVIIDAEQEWQDATNNNQLAEQFMKSLRDKIGDAFIAHAPFSIVNYHQTFPYIGFGKYVDAVMPQNYHTEFRYSINKAISLTDTSWDQFNKAHPESAKPIYNIGVSYGAGYPGITYPLTKEDVLTFLNHYKDAPVSFYSLDASANFPQFWGALAQFNTSNILSQPSSSTTPTTNSTTPVEPSSTQTDISLPADPQTKLQGNLPPTQTDNTSNTLTSLGNDIKLNPGLLMKVLNFLSGMLKFLFKVK